MKALFLDRDGVINDNKRPVNKPEDFIIFDGVERGLKKAIDAGYEIFVVTNQGGIELGFITHEELKLIHEYMQEKLKEACIFKEIIYCPDYHKKSDYRKPAPGMLLELRDKYMVDMDKSWMIGDNETDAEAGIAAGCRTAKVGEKSKIADITGENLEDVIDMILKIDKQ
ncbi:HAD-IIIA family hydrolase [Clostridiaceae bacterium M8S5]|nr:HAD-IIIA family hydrolase [Clostridiaceae bacterium M8S5]